MINWVQGFSIWQWTAESGTNYTVQVKSKDKGIMEGWLVKLVKILVVNYSSLSSFAGDRLSKRN